MSTFLVHSPKLRFFSASLLFSIAALLFAHVVIAGDAQTGPNFAVNTLADTDDGFCDNLGQGGGNQDCTLREAINAANAYGDGATITFSLSGTILLGSGLPQINRTMTIDGSGRSVVISGNDSVNIFLIFNNFKTLNLNALTIAHAQNNNFGGLFLRYASANITNCTFNDNYNTGSAGGAIWGNEASSLVIVNSTFYNNKATFGAGIHVAGVPNGAPSYLFVYNCTFFNNQVTAGGPMLKGVDIDAVNASAAEVRNTVLVTDASQGTWVNCQGITAGSSNIDNRGFCGETSYPSAEQINLDTLRDNGGPTKTVALLPGSVAIGAGDNTVATHSPVHNLDQRGFVRVKASDPNSDVGAFEAGAVTPPGPVPLNSVVSRMTHGSAGPFDINLAGGNAVECRSGGANGDYTLIFTFANPLVSADAVVTSGIGSVANSQIDGADAHNYVVNLTSVANAQNLTVNVGNVSDTSGDFSSAVPASMGLLIGDVNGNRAVNASDVALTKSRIGQTVDATNFRSDVNASGSFNASDVSAIKATVGTGLP